MNRKFCSLRENFNTPQFGSLENIMEIAQQSKLLPINFLLQIRSKKLQNTKKIKGATSTIILKVVKTRRPPLVLFEQLKMTWQSKQHSSDCKKADK